MPGADGSHGSDIGSDLHSPVGMWAVLLCADVASAQHMPRCPVAIQKGGKLPTRPKQFALRLPAATNKNHVELNGGQA